MPGISMGKYRELGAAGKEVGDRVGGLPSDGRNGEQSMKKIPFPPIIGVCSIFVNSFMEGMPNKAGSWSLSMKRTLKIRIFVVLAVTVLAACCGVGGGYLLGGGLALRQGKHRIQEDATRLMAEEVATLNEAYATIGKMHASPYPYCSAAEIGYFRKLLFQ